MNSQQQSQIQAPQLSNTFSNDPLDNTPLSPTNLSNLEQPSLNENSLLDPPHIMSQHPMQTRSKFGIYKPKIFTATFFEEIEPTAVHEALISDHWRNAMSEEYEALLKNKTWSLVKMPLYRQIVGCKWVYKVKRNVDGFHFSIQV